MKNLKNSLCALFVAALPFALSSCGGDTHEAVMTDMIALTGEVADIVESAKDKESAEAAAKKIDAITSRFEALAKRAEALGEPSPEVTEKLVKESAAKMESVMEKMINAAKSLAENPEAALAIAPAMERFQKASQKFGGK